MHSTLVFSVFRGVALERADSSSSSCTTTALFSLLSAQANLEPLKPGVGVAVPNAVFGAVLHFYPRVGLISVSL